ncbi:MAG TPA: hypothetical protein VHJ20_01025 [Polyangia bacterium]|nr:hypothetical protein [Polyangia bacterium]
MRYVDLDDLELPAGWLERAAQASAAVAAGADPNDHAAVWRELKDHLAALLPEKKCWYCEVPVDRADNAVDHFRPKNRVIDAAEEHSGYRWLAFRHMNYRYSCTYCNSRRKDVEHETAGGKADRFPLLDETTRVFVEGPLDDEKPALLDPCELHDWESLGCMRENGQPCPTSDVGPNRKRAEISIEVYHLNYEPTCKQRHAVAVQLLADVEEAKRNFLRAAADASRESDFKIFARKVKRAISRKAPFSGEMIFLLRGQRHADHPWIQTLLEA